MIAVILAAWTLWSFPIGHPADAKSTGHYFPTQAQCANYASDSYRGQVERVKQETDDQRAAKRKTFGAILHFECAPSDVPRETIVQGFRERFHQNPGFSGIFWSSVKEVGFWRTVGIFLQVAWDLLMKRGR
jgi:hypothetical protein